MSEQPEKKVDEEWKERVRRERGDAEPGERNQETPAAAESQPPPQGESKQPEQEPSRQLPPASFGALLLSLCTQALIALGAVEDPLTGKRETDLPQARFTIDLLGILEEKTRGNLTPEEKEALDANLFQFRMQYVEATKEKPDPSSD